MAGIITLTTDFGTADAYTAAMKGVILGINPQAQIVDISSSVNPQDILQAAFILDTAYPFFPPGTVHLVVVDPEVGTQRQTIILKTPSALFIAPDNGVLSYVAQPFLFRHNEESQGPCHMELRPEAEAVVITNPRYWRSPVSPTFHGRDILAPVAAHLSLGIAIDEFGARMKALTVMPLPHPFQTSDGSLTGHIIHIDSFGNLITDIKSNDLTQPTITVEVRDQLVTGLSRTYAEGKGLTALIGSSGRLEIALKKGSAANLLKAAVGNEVRVRHISGV